MLSWSYSGIPEVQSEPYLLWQVLNHSAKRSDFAAVTKPALSLFKERLGEQWDLLLEELLNVYFPTIWGTCCSLLSKCQCKVGSQGTFTVSE